MVKEIKRSIKPYSYKRQDGTKVQVKGHKRTYHTGTSQQKDIIDMDRLKTRVLIDQDEKVIKAIHAKLRDLGTEGRIDAFYDRGWKSVSVYDDDLIFLNVWDKDLNCTEEVVITPKVLRKLENALPIKKPKKRFMADDLDDIHRDINSLIASGDLTVKQRTALSKTAKTLQDIKTGEI